MDRVAPRRDAEGCFARGQANSVGLRPRFEEDADGIRAEFTPGPQYQGSGTLMRGA